MMDIAMKEFPQKSSGFKAANDNILKVKASLSAEVITAGFAKVQKVIGMMLLTHAGRAEIQQILNSVALSKASPDEMCAALAKLAQNCMDFSFQQKTIDIAMESFALVQTMQKLADWPPNHTELKKQIGLLDGVAPTR